MERQPMKYKIIKTNSEGYGVWVDCAERGCSFCSLQIKHNVNGEKTPRCALMLIGGYSLVHPNECEAIAWIEKLRSFVKERGRYDE